MRALYAFLLTLALTITGCTNNYEAPKGSPAPADTGTELPDSGGTEDSDTSPDDSGSDTDTAPPETDCTDGVDNDGDDYLDSEDPGCQDGDGSELPFDEPDPTDCTDGVDNDGDGYSDETDPGCEDGDGSELPFDEPEEVEETPEECWDGVPFTLQSAYINYAGCTDLGLAYEDCFTATDWDSLKYVDAETIRTVNAYSGSAEVPVYSPDDGDFEADVFLPTVTDWTNPTTSYENNMDNSVVAVLEPDGKATEFSYFSFSGGTYRGYVLPDDDANRQDACEGPGYDTENWISGHGGPHSPSATQSWRECEITGACAVTRPLPLEADKTHLRYDASDPYCSAGYTGWAASADSYAATQYTGTVEGLCMGSFLNIPPTWNDADEDGEVDYDPNWDHSGLVNGELTFYDCSSNMQSVPGYQYCVAATQYFVFIIDDSGGEDEIQIPVAMEVQTDGSYNDVIAEVIAATGVDLVNAWYEDNPDGESGPYECDGDEDETVAWTEDLNLLMSMAKVVVPDLVIEP